MRLPIGFFDTKMIGDIMQRIGDHSHIQNFLTSTTLSTLFSFVNLIIFSVVLGIYSLNILGIFLHASTLYILWILIFLRCRRELDFKRFDQAAANQSTLFQMITGMQEIKMNNCEPQKRWEWENIQAKLFKVSIKSLVLSQSRQAGAFFINETKNIIISFFAAKAVISGDMTLGMMLSVQYIIGQLNSPIGNLISFIQAAQDAKISMERLGEIHNREDEESVNESRLTIFPPDRNIAIQDLSFAYTGNAESVLKNLSLCIPESKITAIVGMSGSGKTTLVKMMLGFYPPTMGEIQVGDIDLASYSTHV
jgi:ATP-binding cassette subfamily B protein